MKPIIPYYIQFHYRNKRFCRLLLKLDKYINLISFSEPTNKTSQLVAIQVVL
ncbi:hypothetical protein NC653_008264 [Populus alba x Populus x berolinensis]|uniref:Uncharacterized protein n=1 Tax=Populus alba x Populus x berolinensis TaxID=444605 RepID=A0AAD6R612_9ROSI|nr:hypothetical protein NC653_008264 [Populus alba x Populus x berolinensis]